jgi:lipoate-protein ligase B
MVFCKIIRHIHLGMILNFPMRLLVKNTSVMEYCDWCNRQSELLTMRQKDMVDDALYLVEHPPVYTIGRTADPSTELSGNFDPQKSTMDGIPVVKSERGGGVMFHNPGQLVGYPIIKLRPGILKLRNLMWLLEEAMVRTLDSLDVKGFRRPDIHPGVWTAGGKIGFIGIGIRRKVVFHGFALNICNKLHPFDNITVCGLPNEGVTSVQEITGNDATVSEVKEIISRIFTDVWNENLASLKISRQSS